MEKEMTKTTYLVEYVFSDTDKIEELFLEWIDAVVRPQYIFHEKP